MAGEDFQVARIASLYALPPLVHPWFGRFSSARAILRGIRQVLIDPRGQVAVGAEGLVKPLGPPSGSAVA